jgi:hypothetical protein
VNAKGGRLGRKIEFVVYDDQSMPATAVKLYEKLITEDKVDAVMGPYSFAVSEAVANVTEKYKMGLCETVFVLDHGEKLIEGPPGLIQADERVIEAYFGG